MVKKNTKKNKLKKIGTTAFIIGVIAALIVGFLAQLIGEHITTSILVLLGLVVGFLNISEHEVKDYLLAAVSLVIVTALGSAVLGGIVYIGPYLGNVLQAIMTFVIPATIIVALKEIHSLAKD